MNWKRTRSLNGKSGRFCAPSAIFTNSLHFPALSDTVTLHNSDLPFITITLYLLWTLVMIKTRFLAG
ncbi:hypothetical protein DMN57_24140 [Escherichia coli]|nr:hypothetical protein [Escherichia coli]